MTGRKSTKPLNSAQGSKKGLPGNSQGNLLNDLESIRALLDEPESAQLAGPANKQVPLLDDVVAGIFNLDEDPPTEPAEIPQQGGLDDELFDVLLGDDWRQASADLLDDARATIETNSNVWTPDDTNELNEALQVRIDATLQAGLRSALIAHAGQIRAELLTAVGRALNEQVEKILNSNNQKTGSSINGQ